MLSFLLEISIDLHEIGWSFAYHCISGMMILSHSCRIFGLYNASKWPASGDKLHSSNQSSQTLGNALWTSLVKAMASLSVIWHECIYSLSITIKTFIQMNRKNMRKLYRPLYRFCAVVCWCLNLPFFIYHVFCCLGPMCSEEYRQIPVRDLSSRALLLAGSPMYWGVQRSWGAGWRWQLEVLSWANAIEGYFLVKRGNVKTRSQLCCANIQRT